MIKLEISTHSGDTDIVEVDEYNALDVAEKLNDNDTQALAFGDNVYSRIDIKNIKLVKESEEEDEIEDAE